MDVLHINKLFPLIFIVFGAMFPILDKKACKAIKEKKRQSVKICNNN